MDLLARTKINIEGTIEQIGLLTPTTDLGANRTEKEIAAMSTPMGDTMYYQFLRSLGLVDKSMLAIEKDLREKHAKTLNLDKAAV